MTFLNYEFGKGHYTFYLVILSCFAEKKIKFVGNTNNSFIQEGTLMNWVNCLPRAKKSKDKRVLEGFGISHFMNLLEYGKLLQDKSFPKRILVLTPTNL